MGETVRGVHKVKNDGYRSEATYCGWRGPKTYYWKNVTCRGCINMRELRPAIRRAARTVAKRLLAQEVSQDE